MNWKTFNLIFSLLLLLSPTAVNAENPLSVTYNYQGQAHKLIGEYAKGTYIFNSAADKVVKLATLNWPPYIGEELCNKGWVFQLAVALLVHQHYQVQVTFFPWARAVKEVEQGDMDILFPEYFIEDSAPSDVYPEKKRKELLALSNQFPGGNISFIKRKGEVITFDGDLDKIKGKTIGVVRGYQNTPEFDAMMDAGLINVVEANNELQLLKLLLSKRVELVIGDPKVFQYSINYSSLSTSIKMAMLDNIQEVEPALKYNYLYFAVSRKSEDWKQLLDQINRSLLEFELSGETRRIVALDSGCKFESFDF